MTEQANHSAFGSLTVSERAVLDLLLEFKTSSQIADALGTSVGDIERRVERVQSRLGARSRAELARTYSGLLRQDPVTDHSTSVWRRKPGPAGALGRFLKAPPLGSSRRTAMSWASTAREVFQTAYLGAASLAALTVFVLALDKTVN